MVSPVDNDISLMTARAASTVKQHFQFATFSNVFWLFLNMEYYIIFLFGLRNGQIENAWLCSVIGSVGTTGPHTLCFNEDD